MGENDTKIDFVLIKKQHCLFMRYVNAIPGEFQHSLVIADIDKKKIGYAVRKTYTCFRKMSLVKDVKIRRRF